MLEELGDPICNVGAGFTLLPRICVVALNWSSSASEIGEAAGAPSAKALVCIDGN